MAFNRMFGKKKEAAPPPTLDDAVGNCESRQETYEKKIAKLDQELRKYNEQMRKMRDGPSKNMVKKRALRVLKQKRQFEQQLDNSRNISFNMMNVSDAMQNVKDTQTTVAAMKAGAAELKAGMKKVDINAVEDLQDEMEDLLEDTAEMQEILSRSYDGVEVDDEDLEAELDAMGDYELDDVFDAPDAITDAPVDHQIGIADGDPAQPAAGVDDYGLPSAVPAGTS